MENYQGAQLLCKIYNLQISKLGETLYKALPPYHVLIGCDYTASLFIKGKGRSIEFLQKNIEAQTVLSDLSDLEK